MPVRRFDDLAFVQDSPENSRAISPVNEAGALSPSKNFLYALTTCVYVAISIISQGQRIRLFQAHPVKDRLHASSERKAFAGSMSIARRCLTQGARCQNTIS
jgi:hypothetical protein